MLFGVIGRVKPRSMLVLGADGSEHHLGLSIGDAQMGNGGGQADLPLSHSGEQIVT
jgi:hypothetical protein